MGKEPLQGHPKDAHNTYFHDAPEKLKKTKPVGVRPPHGFH
jgi:hypothetical protein